MIQKWLNKDKPATISFKLIYRGSRDGYTADAFHQKCGHTANTITLIKTPKNYIFGGYIEGNWKPASIDRGHYKKGNAFIFSTNLKEIYVAKASNINGC
jgi:hypothetical protein